MYSSFLGNPKQVRMFVFADSKKIPTLTRQNYLSYHIHSSKMANNDEYIFTTDNELILDYIKSKTKTLAHIAEVKNQDLILYSNLTNNNIAFIHSCFCDIASKTEMCEVMYGKEFVS